MTTAVRVSAPSRLHFGLLRFGHDPAKSFGGLGMMIDQPRVEVELRPANQWHAEGPQSDRALQVAQSVSHKLQPDNTSPLHIQILNLPPTHCGLGTGTQLDFSIAAGIYQLLGFNIPSADELATVTNRGKRSAVGSHGFLSGGLIWETGQQQPNSLGSLAKHLMVPSEWHVLLIRLPEPAGLHGKTEGAAFDQLPAIPVEVTQKMQSLAEQAILPAVQSADFATFSNALYEYGYLAGDCFAKIQGGPFASPGISNLTTYLRDQGIAGVGQSSWGPTVFAFTESKATATTLASQLQNHSDYNAANITITSPASSSATISHC